MTGGMTGTIAADICVIGAGSAGLSIAAGASQMGAETVLIEKGVMGGDCLNTGCVPSKALLVAAKAGPALQRMEAGFRENALNYLLVLRLIPLFPFWLVNLVPAFLGVSLRHYVIGTFIGIIPGTFVYASLGNGLGAILDAGGAPDLKIIFSPEILIPIVGMAVLALLPVVYKRWKARQAKGG